MKYYIDSRLLSNKNNPPRYPTITDIIGKEARASNGFYQTVELDLDGSGGGVVIFGPFDSDEDAGVGGVEIGQIYKVGEANIYGLPTGTIKERTI